jgi:nucleotide-binding universal stress UspA family protein
MTTYNKILVPYDSSKPFDIALEHAITIVKMSTGYSTYNIVNVIVFYVTPVIHIPITVGTILLKSNKTGETISIT